MNNNKLPGADGLYSRVLNELRYEIAQLLMGGCKSVVYIILSTEEVKVETGVLIFFKGSWEGEPSVLGSARTGLIFTGLQEVTQLGGADPIWPNRARYSIPCAIMLGSGVGGGVAGTHSRSGAFSKGGESSSVLLVCFVYSPCLYRCRYCSLCLLFC